MIDELWTGILDFTEQFVLPDWGTLITRIPVLLLLLVALFLSWIGWRFATAGPTRRGGGRIAPVPPPTVHMPGPSYAPVVVAVGATLLFFGLVVGGAALGLGVAALALSLLYWGREALVDFDHLVHREPLPAVVHAGPPPGVHLPGPSFRPLLASLATAVLFFGLVFGGWLLAAGILFVVVTLLGWLNDARREYVKVEEADRTGHLENLHPPAWPRRLLAAFAVVAVVAVLLDLGILLGPDEDTTAGGAPSGAPASGAPGSGAPSDADATVIAKDVAFDTDALTVTAGTPFTLELRNEDAAAIPHDIDIRDEAGEVLQDQEAIAGGETRVYEFEPLEAGSYVFICSIHPVPAMTGTLTVE